MEYVEGQNLFALVSQRGPLAVATAVDFVLQIARGLEFAHRQEHRSPRHQAYLPNLLLDPRGVVKDSRHGTRTV